MLLYTSYQPIFYATHDQHFPSDSEERAVYWVGFAEHCGDSLTHKVLDAGTLKIIHRSALKPRILKNPNITEFRQPLQVQSHLEMPWILVQLGHIQRT